MYIKSPFFILIIIMAVFVLTIFVLWSIYIGSFKNISIFKLRYRFMSLLSTPAKMDKFNNKSIENAKKDQNTVTILIHGAGANYYKDMYGTAVWFKEQGINAISFDYNYKDPPDVSAKKLSLYVDYILGQTGTQKVNIIGVCLGGVLLEYYAEKLDGAKNIDKLITVLSPLNPIPENELFYKFDKTFIFNPDPWNKFNTSLNGKDPVQKSLHIYSTNDNIIPTKYQFQKGDNFVAVDIGHSPLMNVDPEILNLALNFINRKNNDYDR